LVPASRGAAGVMQMTHPHRSVGDRAGNTDRIPAIQVRHLRPEPCRAILRFRHQLLDDLIDGEAGRLLAWWELFEALEPLMHDRLRGVLERDVLDEPVVVPDAFLTRSNGSDRRSNILGMRICFSGSRQT
jgi:hypothetical protein